ncbi:MAG: hypothetical protein R2706_08320 [Acidimicrobiales bacterium]
MSPIAAEPDDETVEQLVDYFERVNGRSYPDWAEYRQAMVDERRLIARFRPAGCCRATQRLADELPGLKFAAVRYVERVTLALSERSYAGQNLVSRWLIERSDEAGR